MTLIIEDGSLVADANSYITVAEARTFATARGVALSATDTDVEALIIKAMDYVEAKGDDFKGNRVSATQSLSWPRECVSLFGFDVLNTTIPTQLLSAVCAAVLDVNTFGSLMPTIEAGGMIIEDTTGPLTTKFSDKFGARDLPSYTMTDALLKPLYKNAGRFTVGRA